MYVRPFTDTEQQALREGLRSSKAIVWRRCQILLASARGQPAQDIATTLGCDDQTIRNAIHPCNARGLAALPRGSSPPHHTPHAICNPDRRERLRALLHHSPRTFGKPPRAWTRRRAADVAYAQGMIPRAVSGETIRHALAALKTRWTRATHGITSPDPADARKKNPRDRLIRLATHHPSWVLGFADDVWWSRLAQPAMHAWAPAESALRLVEQARAPDDPEPKALAGDGLLRRPIPMIPEQLWLRLATGQPVSALTVQCLAWCCDRLATLGMQAVLRVWDHASWHTSQQVRTWWRAHHQQVKQTG